MELKRDRYLDELITRKWNGSIKVITGVRRCGKSYLVFKLFKEHLLSEGVDPDNIIEIALDEISNKPLREPLALYEKIMGSIKGDKCYVLLDENSLNL